jgi:hypothetical protein
VVARRSISVCDVCEQVGRPVTRYKVERGGERFSVELCAEHGAPIDQVLDRAGAQVVGRRRPSFEETITTVEELERRKAALRQAGAAQGS